MKDSIFEFEHADDILILVPNLDLRELEFDALEAGVMEVFDQLEAAARKDVILDFYRTDYYGSTALAFFVKFWKRVKAAGGEMIFCNVSPHELEVLELTKLNLLWAICETRDDAIKKLQGG